MGPTIVPADGALRSMQWRCGTGSPSIKRKSRSRTGGASSFGRPPAVGGLGSDRGPSLCACAHSSVSERERAPSCRRGSAERIRVRVGIPLREEEERAKEIPAHPIRREAAMYRIGTKPEGGWAVQAVVNDRSRVLARLSVRRVNRPLEATAVTTGSRVKTLDGRFRPQWAFLLLSEGLETGLRGLRGAIRTVPE